MREWIVEMIGQYGWWAVGGLIFIENVFPPIPSEVILTFTGFMTVHSALSMPASIAAATAGSLTGAAVLYAVGGWMGADRLRRWLSGRAGRMLRIKPTDLDRAMAWMEKKGRSAVFFCRFVPMVRSLISLPAGMAGMKLPGFLILTGIGSAIWNGVLIGLGAAFGAAWETVSVYLDTYGWVALAACALSIAIALVRRRRKPRRVT
ncbi:MAG: DedA family protein [Acutalibacteraceae bacterium]|jgi:membrane protein DedA with SNARE-associated domain